LLQICCMIWNSVIPICICDRVKGLLVVVCKLKREFVYVSQPQIACIVLY